MRIVSTVKVLTMLVWTITLQVLHYVSMCRWYLTFSKSSPQLEELVLNVSIKPGNGLPERRRRSSLQERVKLMSTPKKKSFYLRA